MVRKLPFLSYLPNRVVTGLYKRIYFDFKKIELPHFYSKLGIREGLIRALNTSMLSFLK